MSRPEGPPPPDTHAGTVGEVIKSLVANVTIACAKAVAAVLTGSGAMLAETLHSFADCGNQILLLVGVRASRRPADAGHPLGYGRAQYFYSFIVALLLFFGGGVFSIREGVEKLRSPEPIGDIHIALAILAFSMLLEGASLWSNVRAIGRRRNGASFWRYLRDTKDSDLIIVFGENGAAVVGLTLAAVALVLARETGDARWDGAGSLAIGLVLVGVATFLAREIKSLLVGEAADPALRAKIDELAAAHPNVERVLATIAVQQGPGEIMLAIKLALRGGLETTEVIETINAFERAIKLAVPDVRWSFIEPDNAD